MHFLKKGNKLKGIYNAGFENLSIMDIAKEVAKIVPAEIIVTESNDPRSYRLSSNKLLVTGFSPKYSVMDGIRDIIEAYGDGKIKDEENCYNIKIMEKLKNFS